MSCHDIGHALNYVQEEIIEQYENGKLDKDTAKTLLIRAEKQSVFVMVMLGRQPPHLINTIAAIVCARLMKVRICLPYTSGIRGINSRMNI